MNRKLIKKEARKSLKRNYWRCVAVVFFVSLFIGTFTISSPNFSYKQIPILNSFNFDVATDIYESITKISIDFSDYKPTRGIGASLFNNITTSGNFIFGLLNSLNQLIFHERIWASLIILLGAIITFLYWFFIRPLFIVGENRFFLENKNYYNTHFKRLFLPFKVKKCLNISLAMFRKTLYEWLWWLTIIGGIIKHYSYALVPYILAENPGIKGKEAIKLSEDLMQNHKWELFLFDLSFLLWYIIDFVTFHIAGIIYVMPYKKNCMANFYLQISRDKKVLNSNLLCDTYLLKTGEVYPKNKYIYLETKAKISINSDFNKNYSITTYILLFFAAAIIGWLWEVGYHLYHYGSFVNRGALHGPWLPIYGWGMVLLLILLKKYRNDPFRTFILSMIICGLVEYGTSCYLEYFKHASWWDYDGYFLNINGRICLEGLIAFGIGGCAFIYFAAPFLDSLFSKINKKIKIGLCIILSLCYIVDAHYSSSHPNTGSGVSKELQSFYTYKI